MRKNIFLLCVFFLLPAAAQGSEKTLYDISENIMAATESTFLCLSDRDACSQADAELLQEQARGGLQDLCTLMRSGNAARMKITGSQARLLSVRLEVMHNLFVHTEMFEMQCNKGIELYAVGRAVLNLVLSSPRPIQWLNPLLWVLVAVIIVIYAGTLAVACILMLSCLFWWL